MTKPEFIISLFIVRVNLRLRLDYLVVDFIYFFSIYLLTIYLLCTRLCGMPNDCSPEAYYFMGQEGGTETKARLYHISTYRTSWLGQRGLQHRGKVHLICSVSLTSRVFLKVLVHDRVNNSPQFPS